MKTPLLTHEAIIKQGAANLQRGAETVGGKLYLTNQRLVFEAHRFNLQKGATTIPLTTIAEVQGCWTKFLNRVPLVPNSMAVVTQNNRTYRFMVNQRQAWLDAIANQRDDHLPTHKKHLAGTKWDTVRN